MITAACFCGAVSLRFETQPQSAVHCHCGECRRLSGAAFTTWVSLPRNGMSICGEASLSAFKVTSNVTRHFCRICGSHAFTSDLRLPGIVGVPAGIFDGGSPVAATAHYFVRDKATWYAILDALPQLGSELG